MEDLSATGVVILYRFSCVGTGFFVIAEYLWSLLRMFRL